MWTASVAEDLSTSLSLQKKVLPHSDPKFLYIGIFSLYICPPPTPIALSMHSLSASCKKTDYSMYFGVVDAILM